MNTPHPVPDAKHTALTPTHIPGFGLMVPYENYLATFNSHAQLREALQAIVDECPNPKLPYGLRVVEIARTALKESEAK